MQVSEYSLLRLGEVCVRLIKRFIIYPTKCGHLPRPWDNFAKCEGNTCMKSLATTTAAKHFRVFCCGAGGDSPKQKPTP